MPAAAAPLTRACRVTATVVTLGECLISLVAEEPGPLAEAATFERHIAGAEANVAVGLARLGQSVAYIGRVGSDGFGVAIVRRLRAEGVDVRHLTVDTTATTGIMLRERRVLGPAQVVYARTGSAGSRLSVEDVDRAAADGLFSDARWLHLTGITPALSGTARDAVMRAVELAHEAELTVSLDVNLRRRLWSDEAAAPIVRALARQADIVLGSPDELAVVTGSDAADPGKLARAVLALGPSIAVVKLGADGALGAKDGSAPIRVPALPVPSHRGSGRRRRCVLGRVHRGSPGRRGPDAAPCARRMPVARRRWRRSATSPGSRTPSSSNGSSHRAGPTRCADGPASMTSPTDGTEADARALDDADPLSAYRDRFLIPPGPDGPGGEPAIYLAGQSLGLQARDVRPMVETQLDRWARLGVEGHFATDPPGPWFTDDETFREPMARIVGARPSEVAVLNTLTVNLHLLLASFFRPAGARRRDPHRRPAVPLRSACARQPSGVPRPGPGRRPRRGRAAGWRGPRPCRGPRGRDRRGRRHPRARALRRRELRDRAGAAGPAPDTGRPCGGGHVGWQMAHGAGNLPLALHDDDVDFAVWCTYKYLNGGPGSVGAIFVHERHTRQDAQIGPALTGWWGAVPDHRFDPTGPFVADTGAAAWKMSTSPLFNMVPLAASLAIFDEVGMPALRERSIRLTAYLERLLDELGIEILTPRDPDARGAQLSCRFADAPAVLAAIEAHGVVADFRAPDIIRLAPIPLYNSFHDLWRLGEVLRLR